MARFDLTDFEWSIIEPLLSQKSRGAKRVDDRRVLSGIFWHLRTGALWADIPAPYGPYTACSTRVELAQSFWLIVHMTVCFAQKTWPTKEHGPISGPCPIGSVIHSLANGCIASAIRLRGSLTDSNTSGPLQPDTTNETIISLHPYSSHHCVSGSDLVGP